MDVHHLRYFVAVAEAGSLAAAAEYLGISASPLSRRIRDLEAHMGDALFVRTTRGSTLAPLGERLLPATRRVLLAYDQVEELRVARPVLGPIRVGLVPGIAPELSAVLLRAISVSRPGSPVDFYPADSPTQHERIRQGRLDLATIRRTEVDARLESMHLVDEVIVPYVSATAAESLRAPLTPGELRGWTVVLSYQPTFSASLMEFFADQGIEDFRVVSGADASALAVLAHAPRTLTFGLPNDIPAGTTALSTRTSLLMETRLVWRKDRRDLDDVIRAIAFGIPNIT